MTAQARAEHHFYPRSPCGERPELTTLVNKLFEFLSTLSLRRATAAHNITARNNQFLSTLSLRRATCYSFRHPAQGWYFYPRSPCGERLSSIDDLEPSTTHFYPRSPCGERLDKVLPDPCGPQFLSTLSLRRATGRAETAKTSIGFLSTLSLRRATAPEMPTQEEIEISIHALLAESDCLAPSPLG